MANVTSIVKPAARIEHDSDLIGSDSGYEAGNEWAGGQTVGEWRRSRQRRTRPPLRTTMETSTDTEEEAGDEEYEADDEWSRRPKISQIRKYMKRKKWGRPRTPTETEDSDYLRHNGFYNDDRERDEYQPGDLKLDSDFDYGYGD